MIGFFTIGELVKVYPHGSPRRFAIGQVILISENQRSIAVCFDDKPPFCTIQHGVIIYRGEIVMALYREEHGPWIELIGNGQFEIENLKGTLT